MSRDRIVWEYHAGDPPEAVDDRLLVLDDLNQLLDQQGDSHVEDGDKPHDADHEVESGAGKLPAHRDWNGGFKPAAIQSMGPPWLPMAAKWKLLGPLPWAVAGGSTTACGPMAGRCDRKRDVACGCAPFAFESARASIHNFSRCAPSAVTSIPAGSPGSDSAEAGGVSSAL